MICSSDQVIFYWKISEQTFICYVLNIVNNGKYLFIYLFLCLFIYLLIYLFFYFLLYVTVDRKRNYDILSKRQNNKVSFTCQLGLGRIWLAAFVFIYLCIARIFVTDTKWIYNAIQHNQQEVPARVSISLSQKNLVVENMRLRMMWKAQEKKLTREEVELKSTKRKASKSKSCQDKYENQCH